MNKQRILQALENVKSIPYGKWGILNIEQRRFIKELCDSWLILDDATNKQMEEIERLNNIIKEAINYIDDNTYYKDHKGHINIDDLYLILQKGSESNE